MDVTFRPAMREDIPSLSRLHLLATDGLLDAVYHNAIPGLSPNEIYERVLARVGTVRSYEHASVAVKGGTVIGEVHAYPFDDEANDPPNPFIPKDRFVLYEPFHHLHSQPAGTYHINILSVHPEFRCGGIGTALMRIARSRAYERGFSKISPFVFDSNHRAVTLYERLGFVVLGGSPLVTHELLDASGDLLLMTGAV
jgi:ribosomal protein S18 acetylase RimI-like enzyme